MTLFDTHAHYTDNAFGRDRTELLGQLLPAAGVAAAVTAGVDVESSRASIALAEEYHYIYAAAGIHPEDCAGAGEAELAEIRTLCRHPKVIAVGEIGLDYYWDKEKHDLQKEWFVRQLALARQEGLPVNVHSREAAADTMEILKEHGRGMDVIVHCYSYSREMAEEYVKMGYLIGVGGVVTFKNAKKLKEAVQAVPLSHIVLETDCPYLAPEPYRGKRNSSLNLAYVAQAVAELKGVTAEEVIRATEENAQAFYRIT